MTVHLPSSTENGMVGMNSSSSEYKVLEQRDIITKGRLVHSVENVIKQEFNNLFGVLIAKEELINISSAIAFDYEIVEVVLASLQKQKEVMNHFTR